MRLVVIVSRPTRHEKKNLPQNIASKKFMTNNCRTSYEECRHFRLQSDGIKTDKWSDLSVSPAPISFIINPPLQASNVGLRRREVKRLTGIALNFNSL